MPKVIRFRSAPPGKRRVRSTVDLTLIAEIIEVLELYGGHAHRDLVVDRIAVNRGLHEKVAIDRLTVRIQQVFDANCEGTQVQSQTPVFRRMFGTESRRWTLAAGFSPEGFDEIRQARL